MLWHIERIDDVEHSSHRERRATEQGMCYYRVPGPPSSPPPASITQTQMVCITWETRCHSISLHLKFCRMHLWFEGTEGRVVYRLPRGTNLTCARVNRYCVCSSNEGHGAYIREYAWLQEDGDRLSVRFSSNKRGAQLPNPKLQLSDNLESTRTGELTRTGRGRATTGPVMKTRNMNSRYKQANTGIFVM